MLSKLTDALTRPPPAGRLEPARKSLADLPDAARAGLEPVTGTAQKAFARLLRDVGAVQVSTDRNHVTTVETRTQRIANTDPSHCYRRSRLCNLA